MEALRARPIDALRPSNRRTDPPSSEILGAWPSGGAMEKWRVQVGGAHVRVGRHRALGLGRERGGDTESGDEAGGGDDGLLDDEDLEPAHHAHGCCCSAIPFFPSFLAVVAGHRHGWVSGLGRMGEGGAE